MEIEKLSVGMIIKNYKLLCDLLEESIKTGKSKQLQLKDWDRYFIHHKDGQKFIIDEIFETPKEKIDNRGGNNNTKYIDKIEKLILDLLVQDRNNGQVFLSKNKLLEALKMINENYGFCKRNIPKLSKFMNISQDNIYEFYESSDGTLKRNLESALDSLKSQSLIFWMPVKTVCVVETRVPTNEMEDAQVEEVYMGINKYEEEVFEYKIPNSTSIIHRKATKEEIQLIIHTEREVLIELGCENKQQVIIFKKWDIFAQRMKEELLNSANILFYYDSYEVICNEDHIYEKWEELCNLMLKEDEKLETQDILNKDIIEKIHKNVESRVKKAEKLKEESWDGEFDNDKAIRRLEENYIVDNDKLINNLIDKNAKKIKDDVRKTRLKEKVKIVEK